MKLFRYRISKKSPIAMGGVKGKLYITDKDNLLLAVVERGTKNKHMVAIIYILKRIWVQFMEKKYAWPLIAIIVIIIDVLTRIFK